MHHESMSLFINYIVLYYDIITNIYIKLHCIYHTLRYRQVVVFIDYKIYFQRAIFCVDKTYSSGKFLVLDLNGYSKNKSHAVGFLNLKYFKLT